jgi:histidinol-phosphatase (PHP family)
MIADYHIHTPYCGHAHGKIVQYIESAIDSGIDEIAFTDHLGRYYLSHSQKKRYWDWGMDERNLARYFSEITDLQDIFKNQISIKIGLEIDYIEGAEDLLAPFFANFKLDFCIGSIHCIPHFGWKHVSEYSSSTDADAIYKEYYRLAALALQSNLFQSLGHLDFLWRYISWPKNESNEFYEKISDTVTIAAASNCCIEVNANGYIWSQTSGLNHEKNPFIFMLDEIKRLDAPITIGSDAHSPGMVGKAFRELVALLNSKNLMTIHCFSKGVATKNKLDLPLNSTSNCAMPDNI